MLPDNSCILAVGQTLPNFHISQHLHRFDAAGNQLWVSSYSTQDHVIAAIVPRLDGSYALIGTKARQVGGPTGPYTQDVWIGGLTTWGDTLPARRYPRLRGNDDPAFGMNAALMPDGGLVLAGVTRPLVPPPAPGSRATMATCCASTRRAGYWPSKP